MLGTAPFIGISRPVKSLVARHSCKNGEAPGARVRLFSLA